MRRALTITAADSGSDKAGWPYDVQGYTKVEEIVYVQWDEEFKSLIKRLVGSDTEHQLRQLDLWRKRSLDEKGKVPRPCQVQLDWAIKRLIRQKRLNKALEIIA